MAVLTDFLPFRPGTEGMAPREASNQAGRTGNGHKEDFETHCPRATASTPTFLLETLTPEETGS
jgi:hypothetical protein